MQCNCIKDHSLKECEHFSVPIDFLCRVFADVSPFEATRKEGKKNSVSLRSANVWAKFHSALSIPQFL